MEARLPDLGEGVLEAEVVQWLVKPGDTIEQGQNLVEVLTDKATIDLPSPFAGTIVELRADPGAVVPVGGVLLAFEPQCANVGNGRSQADRSAAMRRIDSPAAERVRAAPSVRRKARELGVNLTQLVGSGPGGRVLAADLSQDTAAAHEQKVKKCSTRQPMQGVRRKIAEQMVRAKNTIPHYSLIDECDVTRLVALREELKPSFAKRGVKLTYLAFVLKAVAEVLQEVPIVNASYDEDAGEIILHERYDIGVAVATDGGLIVPVIRNVDRLSVSQVAAEIQRLSESARRSKVSRDDLQGGTFTVTSIGNIGGLISTPIINHPQVGILGTGKIVRRPVYDERGELKPADMMYLSLSFDHRVVDGAVGAEFCNAVIGALASPAKLLIQEQG